MKTLLTSVFERHVADIYMSHPPEWGCPEESVRDKIEVFVAKHINPYMACDFEGLNAGVCISVCRAMTRLKEEFGDAIYRLEAVLALDDPGRDTAGEYSENKIILFRQKVNDKNLMMQLVSSGRCAGIASEERTFLHEFGHHLFECLPFDVQQEAEMLYIETSGNGFVSDKSVSTNAKKNHLEYFAETFVELFMRRPQVLSRHEEALAHIMKKHLCDEYNHYGT